MDRESIITDGLNDWAAYFRRKLTTRVADMYKSKMLPYMGKTIKRVFKEQIDYGEKFPFIHEVVAALQRIEQLTTDYHPEEDHRFPMSKMWISFNVLKNNGGNAFYNYCNTVNMPLNDRNRVIWKLKAAHPELEKITEGLLKTA